MLQEWNFWLFILQEHFFKFCIEIWQFTNQLFSFLFHQFFKFFWNRLFSDILTILPVKIISFSMNDINKTSHSVIGSDRNLNCWTNKAKFLSDCANSVPRIGAHSVKFINKNYSWDLISHHLFVNCDCLWLNASYTAYKKNGSVQDSEGSLDFDCKINVAWCIDEIDMIIFPHEMCSSWLNGNTFLLFEFHKIHSSTNRVRTFDFMDGINFSSIKKDSLRECGFSRVNMCWDSNISDFRVVSDGKRS